MESWMNSKVCWMNGKVILLSTILMWWVIFSSQSERLGRRNKKVYISNKLKIIYSCLIILVFLIWSWNCMSYFFLYYTFMKIGTTAVHTSASHGHAACLQLLIDYGANMNVKNHVCTFSLVTILLFFVTVFVVFWPIVWTISHGACSKRWN